MPPCSSPLTCNQPNSTTDARGNVTDYTYSATHGGVLTVTAPAVGGVRPQTRYSYTLTNGEYRLTGTSMCQTGSSCAGTADEVVAAIAYDPSGNATLGENVTILCTLQTGHAAPCAAYGIVYFMGVTVGGQGPYRDAQREAKQRARR